MTPPITTRTWTVVGEPYQDAREQIEKQIAKLEWKDPDAEIPMMPALGIRACIEELPLPRVSAVAYNGVIDYPDPPEGKAYYSVYGIECNYSDGKARVYVLDTGTNMVTLCSDFPIADTADYETGQGRR